MEALITFLGIVVGFGTAGFMALTQMISEAGLYSKVQTYVLHISALSAYVVAAYTLIFAIN